ncbi:MAG: alpha/beta hydrolase [Anaerolineales bacterium]|nr:alpha/beta hydrolase [Anaerolineales bacterium]
MKVNANGVELHYEQAGTGPPLVLVHGFPLNSGIWTPQLDGLAPVARVIAPDLRGHGRSPSVPGPYSMDLFADDIAAMLDELHISEPIILGGLSMGGYIAFAFFRRHRKRLRALILAATRAGEDTPDGKTGRENAAAQVEAQGISPIVQGMLPKMLAPDTFLKSPSVVDQTRRIMEQNSKESYLGDLYGMRDRPDSNATLGEIDLRTLVIHGAEDQLLPVLEAEATHAGIEGSELVVLPGSGHMLNLEQPALFNRAVADFISSLS